ncbi:MAG: Pr6Pr family membrane protein [Rhodobacteraceae bacterium]|nr:Pr6Pr family membrane protein [Paracoccaceae bacterium]
MQTNFLIAVTLTLSLLGIGGNSSAWRGALTVYITLVAVVYHLVLARDFDPVGLRYLTDLAFHTIVPVLFVLDWFLFTRKSGLRYRHAFIWLLIPTAFCIYSLVRGASTNWYPYPFLNVSALGATEVVMNITVLLALFLLAGVFLVWLSRLMPKPLLA